MLVWGQLDCMFNVFELIPKKHTQPGYTEYFSFKILVNIFLKQGNFVFYSKNCALISLILKINVLNLKIFLFDFIYIHVIKGGIKQTKYIWKQNFEYNISDFTKL